MYRLYQQKRFKLCQKSHSAIEVPHYYAYMTIIRYSAYKTEKPPSQINVVFGKNVKRLRREQGLTRVGLAHMSGMSRQLLARIELGDADVRLSYLKRIADALCVNPYEMLKEHED